MPLPPKAVSYAITTNSELPRSIPRNREYVGAMAANDDSEESSDGFNAASSDEWSDLDFNTEFPPYAPSFSPSTEEYTNDSIDGEDDVTESSSKRRMTSLQPGLGFEVYNVEYSRYMNDRYGTGEVRAEMVYKADSTTAPEGAGALFRWVHLKQDPMDFGAFQNIAKSLPDLTEEELMETVELLQSSQRQVQKRLRTKDGHLGRMPDPQVLSKERHSISLRINDRYFFFCLPYFCLRKYSKLGIPSQSDFQPTRTLLQIRDHSAAKERDLGQVVCHLGETPSDECFHLSSLWCLVIKEKYILTCSLYSGAELSGDLLDIVRRPPSQPSVTVSERPPVLQVLFECALYLIPLDECDTWFKLTQKFSVIDKNFDDLYNVYLLGRRIRSGQWHFVIERTRKQPNETRITVSKTKLSSSRSLNKALLRTDDVTNTSPSRPSTPSSSILSSSSRASLEDKHLVREEKANESRADRKSDDFDAPFQAALSPDLVVSNPLKQLPSACPISLEHYLEDFHALRWIALQFTDSKRRSSSADAAKRNQGVSKPESMPLGVSYDEKVDIYLDELHKYMQFKAGAVTQAKYRSCANKSLRDVEKSLTEVITGEYDNAEVVNLKQKIVTAAKSIFLIFLPLNQKGLIVSKYWGAVHASISTHVPHVRLQMRETVNVLMRIARVCIDMQAQLSGGKGPNPAETVLSACFVKAWFNLLVCQLNLAPETINIARKKASSCKQNVERAIENVMNDYKGKSLPALRALVPAELSAFFAHRVLQDMTGDFPSVLDTYREYSIHLESLVNKDRLSKSHQEEVAGFLYELEIIQEQLNRQFDVIKKLDEGPLDQWDHEYEAAFARQYHIQLLKQCRDHLSKTKQSISELQIKGCSLKTSPRDVYHSNKQRKERAIYILTIVTTVFLPISTISNIFAMNVKGIRDMENGQWVFWAVAIPATALVVIGSLFGAGMIPYRGRHTIVVPLNTPVRSVPPAPVNPPGGKPREMERLDRPVRSLH